MSSSIPTVHNHKDRRLHLFVVAAVLLGPVLTLPALKWDVLNFLNLVFPITADSLTIKHGYREFSSLEVLWILFLVKILVIALVLLISLLKHKRIGAMLTRFYVLVFLICLGKLTMFSMYFSDNSARLVLVIGPVVFFGWCLLIGFLFQRHRAFLRDARK